MCRRIMLVILLFIVSVNIAQENKKLLTVAEISNYETTSSYADVMNFIKEIKKISPHIKLESIASSTERRDIPLLVIGNPVPKSAAQLKNDKRIKVYIQGNIHAGEVEGKEAALMFIRDLLLKRKEILKDVILLVCPIFNADGNEPISVKNRTNQNGPKNGVGVRYNGQFLDLNRDAVKLETPEVSGLLANVLNKWDPAIFVDLHTTNGSYHEEPVTFVWQMNVNGDSNLISYMRDKMMPQVSSILSGKYNTLNCFYGEFINQRDYSKGFISYAYEPRYIVNYVGLRNRLAILNENYVYADFKTRVIGCYNLLWSITEYAAQNNTEIKNLLIAADKRTVDRGMNPAASDSFAVKQEVRPTKNPIGINVYEVESYKDQNGRERLRPTNVKKFVTVPYLADYFSTENVKFPFAYLITLKDPRVLAVLKNHGLKIEKLTAPAKLEVETFKITELKPETRSNQGHYLNQVKGEYIKETREFAEGVYVIRTAQPLANVASYLLEPLTEDSMLLWNFFDRAVVPQWGMGYLPYPVYRIMQKTELSTTTIK